MNGGIVYALYRLHKSGKRQSFIYKCLVSLLAILTLTFIILVDSIFRTHWTLWDMFWIWVLMVVPFWIAFAHNQQKTRQKLWSILLSVIAFAPHTVTKYADKWAGKYVEKYVGKSIPVYTVQNLPEDKISGFLRPAILAVCLVWPVLGVFSMAAQHHISRPVRYVMRIPVESYDKRAPITGDYLRFRFYGPHAPDNKYHDYYIPAGKSEIDKVFSHPNDHKMTMEVHILEGDVLSYDMLYIDNMPWQTYLEKEHELCRERMGGEC